MPPEERVALGKREFPGRRALAPPRAQPFGGLLSGQGLELDVRNAAPRSRDGLVQLANALVRRHEDEDRKPLADQAIDEVRNRDRPWPD